MTITTDTEYKANQDKYIKRIQKEEMLTFHNVDELKKHLMSL